MGAEPRRTAAPQRWWSSRLGYRFVIELGLMFGILAVYRHIRYLTRHALDPAMSNATRVMELERRFGVYTELFVQRLALNSDAVIEFLNNYYASVHFTTTVLFLFWSYVRHPGEYRRIRACFISVTVAALMIHVAFPLAPPRMLRDSGFVDTLRLYGPRIYNTEPATSVSNQFAAMPSLHFGWALLVAIGFIVIKRNRISLLTLVHPLITLIAIVATANHFWLDAVVALGLVAVAGTAFQLWHLGGRGGKGEPHDGSVRLIALTQPGTAREGEEILVG